MRRKTTQERKEEACRIHNNQYDYSLWPDEVKLDTVVTNLCPLHGEFSHTIKQHIILKSGCPKCAGRNISLEERKNQAHKIHNNEYDYSLWTADQILVKTTKLKIICKIHGIFEQTLNTHIHSKAGCPKCRIDKQRRTNTKKYGADHHKQKHFSVNTHQYLSDFDWLYEQHVNQKRTQLEIANELGINVTTVGRYLEKFNIPKQYGVSSQSEKELVDWLHLYTNVITNSRSIISPYELDIYLPEYKLAIEYCGLYWHSEQAGKDKWYHKRKYDMCNDKHIQLLTIFEDEWFNKKKIVKTKIESLINSDQRERIYARKCKIVSVTSNEKRDFFEAYHIQGNGPGSINYGLTFNNNLVAVISFIKNDDTFYLNRYATSAHVIGGFSKLLEHFKRNNQWKKLITFADNRWSNGHLYAQTGWTLEKILPPDYYYSPDALQRVHKFNYRRKNLPFLLKTFDENKSEKENCDDNNILRIWDCGKQKFVMYKFPLLNTYSRGTL